LLAHAQLEGQTRTKEQGLNQATFLYPLKPSVNAQGALEPSVLGVALSGPDVVRVLEEYPYMGKDALLTSPMALMVSTLQSVINHGERSAENTPVQFLDLTQTTTTTKTPSSRLQTQPQGLNVTA
jgi:hypothetical protein